MPPERDALRYADCSPSSPAPRLPGLDLLRAVAIGSVANLQKAAKRARDEGNLTQAEKFAKAARDLSADQDGDALKGALRKLTKSKRP